MLWRWARGVSFGLSSVNRREMIFKPIANGLAIWNGVMNIFGQ